MRDSYESRGRRSRSFSPRQSSRKHRKRSRTRSRSPRASHYEDRRYSSPMHRRGPRSKNPAPSRCLGVFRMSVYTTEDAIRDIFSRFGRLEKIDLVLDGKSGRSRGFAFVYYEHLEDAKVAKNQCDGIEIDGRRVSVDYSLTERAHTPTPGIYMGFVNPPRHGFYFAREDEYQVPPPPPPSSSYRRGRDDDNYHKSHYRHRSRSPSSDYRRSKYR